MTEENHQPKADPPLADKDTCDCLALQKECADYKAGWQRELSDYQNLQKDVARQRGEWAAMSDAQMLSEFLPVYDNFKKAFAALHAAGGEPGRTTDDSWTKGIGFIMKQMGDVIKGHGIEEIKTVGEPFDATKHETVGEEESEAEAHTIIREVEGGYMIKGKVLKVAKVIISKTKNPD
jgi:molecular chaperone GrpE